jgi:hydroxyacylglutathione hydrolase
MLQISPIKAFLDNYIWMVQSESYSGAYLVDPGDGDASQSALDKAQLDLLGIIITHHHPDHTGGIDTLLKRYSVPVYGPVNAAIPQITHVLRQGDTIEVFDSIFSVLEVPGHTLDHIAYYADGSDNGCQPVLFCGDTLFAAGCGRVFEGDPAMMLKSLTALRELPGATQIYCAHEYTMGNLSFAQAVEPYNQDLLRRIDSDQALRDKGIPTVPSIIATELATNPFLRCDQASVQIAVAAKLTQAVCGEADVFAAVRSWKDNF